MTWISPVSYFDTDKYVNTQTRTLSGCKWQYSHLNFLSLQRSILDDFTLEIGNIVWKFLVLTNMKMTTTDFLLRLTIVWELTNINYLNYLHELPQLLHENELNSTSSFYSC